MRVALIVIGLLTLAACVQPGPTPTARTAADNADLKRFVEPTDGAPYSQSDMNYYRDNANPGAAGPAGIPRTK